VLLGTPTTVATGPSEADLTEQSRGVVSVRSTAVQGSPLRVSLPVERAGSDVVVFLFSTPGELGEYTVGEDGTFAVPLPAAVAGERKVAVYAADGTLLGWDDVTIKAKKK
jgi:hypothetical protein